MDEAERRRSEEAVRRLVGDLPDARTREQKGQMRTPLGLASPVFCVNCGRQFGFAFVDTTCIFYLCNECEERNGVLDLPVVDEEFVRGHKGRS